jgi:hypothetical protein
VGVVGVLSYLPIEDEKRLGMIECLRHYAVYAVHARISPQIRCAYVLI